MNNHSNENEIEKGSYVMTLNIKSDILTEIHFPLRPKSIIFFSPLKIERLDIGEVKLTQQWSKFDMWDRRGFEFD